MFQKFGDFDRIDEDISFVRKNLASYHDDQQRLLGKTVVEIHESKPTTVINDSDKQLDNTQSDPLTPESQKRLVEIFSS